MDSRNFYFELCHLLNSVNEKYDIYSKNNGIVSNNLLWILYNLSDETFHTQQEIALSCCLPKTTVNTIVKDLEKQGYLLFNQDKDKRKRLISLSFEGKKFARLILKDLFTKEDEIFYQNQSDLENFIELFKKFDLFLEKLNEK